MAKKKEETTENVEVSNDEKEVMEPKEVKKEKKEKEVKEKAVTGEKSKGKYKLKDPKTSYSEREFTLAGDQVKELPDQVSKDLLARIQTGLLKRLRICLSQMKK